MNFLLHFVINLSKTNIKVMAKTHTPIQTHNQRKCVYYKC